MSSISSRSDLRKHVNICVENGYIKEKCTKCDKRFTRFGLRRHIQQCHGNKVEIITCKKCELICKSMANMKKHMKEDHDEEGREVSREVCPHYRRGNCYKGDQCTRSHVGYQHETTSKLTSQTSTSSWTPACKHGIECEWMAKGNCMFFHRGVGVQNLGRKAQQSPSQTRERQKRPCRFGSRCDRIESCSWSHNNNQTSTVDFRHPTKRNQQTRQLGGRSQ